MNRNIIFLIKSITYRFYSSFITFLISYFITKQVSTGVFIGLSDFTIKIFTYYFYEYIWEKIKDFKQKQNR
jgi:uncharacterized membrane protein